jgi:hypothetical protein
MDVSFNSIITAVGSELLCNPLTVLAATAGLTALVYKINEFACDYLYELAFESWDEETESYKGFWTPEKVDWAKLGLSVTQMALTFLVAGVASAVLSPMVAPHVVFMIGVPLLLNAIMVLDDWHQPPYTDEEIDDLIFNDPSWKKN